MLHVLQLLSLAQTSNKSAGNSLDFYLNQWVRGGSVCLELEDTDLLLVCVIRDFQGKLCACNTSVSSSTCFHVQMFPLTLYTMRERREEGCGRRGRGAVRSGVQLIGYFTVISNGWLDFVEKRTAKSSKPCMSFNKLLCEDEEKDTGWKWSCLRLCNNSHVYIISLYMIFIPDGQKQI